MYAFSANLTLFYLVTYVYTGWPKKLVQFLYALTVLDINRFANLFHCQNHEKICNNTVTKDPITP